MGEGAGGPCGAALTDATGCTAEVTPVRHEGRVLGLVAVLAPRPVEPVRAPSPSRPAGALVGGSVPWRHAVARATSPARAAGSPLVVGEQGTGKTTLALELLDGTAPLVLYAAESPELGLHASSTPWRPARYPCPRRGNAPRTSASCCAPSRPGPPRQPNP
ncbi:hypothetical protein [Streptomyces viridochromogenes]|uniref:Uncharacterized protein n=1 Tax=Streptomyces viridochromogenes Tue57 TaxID=1160705 RepID=L8PST2_STRVR|nr:hypothetical protein [Streptomyces viridochromogenes]ELS58482.1 hypothetical protein STVIR_0562 [Streptomyces viridochromogenes Tue57]